MTIKLRKHHISSAQFSSIAQSCPTLCDPVNCSMPRPPCPSPTLGVHPNPCPSSRWHHPAISSAVVPFSSCPQSLPASESFPMSQLYMRWPKYWSFSFSIIPSKEHPRLISFRMDWLDLLAVQGTLMSLLQHHSLRASILRRSGLYYVEVGSFYAHFLKSFLPGEGNGNPLQYSCLENPTDGGAW